MSRAVPDDQAPLANGVQDGEEDHKLSAVTVAAREPTEICWNELKEALRLLQEARAHTKNMLCLKERIDPHIISVRRLLAKQQNRQ